MALDVTRRMEHLDSQFQKRSAPLYFQLFMWSYHRALLFASEIHCSKMNRQSGYTCDLSIAKAESPTEIPPAGNIAHLGSVVSIAVGDFNHDGIPDMAGHRVRWYCFLGPPTAHLDVDGRFLPEDRLAQKDLLSIRWPSAYLTCTGAAIRGFSCDSRGSITSSRG